MNRFFRILVPIILSVAVLLSVGWYIMEYDPDFTRDMLVSQARKQSDSGNHDIATWLYELAYRHSGKDETVAIELAEQFKDTGNYTKAEYTLSHAISDGGSAELYIALCRTYVEQDKLLDAVTMLEHIADPVIKEEVAQLRPAAPTATPEQGFYNQYINVTVQSDDGALYTTTDGEYPSTAVDLYTGPISLTGGETTIYALTVAPSGLVSPLTILSYTVTGVIEEVTLSDPALDAAVRQKLVVAEDAPLYSDQLWSITTLELPKKTASLEDLKWFPFLHTLTIAESSLTDLSALGSMSSLQTLVITDTPVSAECLTAIAGLPKLTSLTLRGCGLSGISPLSAAVGLQTLDLSSNAIGDVSALTAMPMLSRLDLSHNALSDLEHFRNMPSLTTLNIGFNSISDSTPLENCTALTELDLTGNLLTQALGISQIPGLRSLSLAHNQLTDVSSLAVNTSLETLDISNNSIADISGLYTLNNLVTFNFSYNNISQIPQFSMDCALVTIKGSKNQITSLMELRGLSNLNYVMMDYNPDLISIAPLSTCERLIEVSVYGTAVTDVTSVTKTDKGQNTGIIVKYSPV